MDADDLRSDEGSPPADSPAAVRRSAAEPPEGQELGAGNPRRPPRRRPRPPAGAPEPDEALDGLGRRLLRLLAADPRRGAADLARELGVSPPTVRERIRRLEESGVLRGYRLDIDPAALGLPVAAWVRVRPGPGQLPRIAQLAAETPQVSECHRVSGEDCFLLKVHVAAVEELEPVLDRFLLYGHTTSSFVVGTPVPPRTLLPEGPGE